MLYSSQLPLSCTSHEASCLIACMYSSSVPPRPNRSAISTGLRIYRVTGEERFQMMEYI
jgi:hypothetical protein